MRVLLIPAQQQQGVPVQVQEIQLGPGLLNQQDESTGYMEDQNTAWGYSETRFEEPTIAENDFNYEQSNKDFYEYDYFIDDNNDENTNAEKLAPTNQ